MTMHHCWVRMAVASAVMLVNFSIAGWGKEVLAREFNQPSNDFILMAMVPVRLGPAEILERSLALPGWKVEADALIYERTFEDFVAAIAFVNRLVEPAEQLGHHPEITINYNRVTLRLTTHDAGGLTELDFQLAQQIEQIE